MVNIKYHAITLSSVILFSYISAVTINGIIKHNLTENPSGHSRIKIMKTTGRDNAGIDINQLLESGFFRTSSSVSSSDADMPDLSSAISDLKLLGTVTGSSAIARALILKKGEKQPGVFKLWKDGYGF